MKYTLTGLLAFLFFTIGCDKTTEPEENNDVNIHSTVNIKAAAEYFNFATNSGSADATAAYDMVFFSVQWQPAPQAPVISDPRFTVKEGLSIAILKDQKLDDVTEIPANSEFIMDYSTAIDGWYSQTDAHLILPNENVWVVNTTDGKFPAFIVTSYYDEEGNSGVFNIEWKYLND